MTRVRRPLTAALAVVLLAGCTHAPSPPMPPAARPLLFTVVAELPAGVRDAPATADLVPGTAVYLSGHRQAPPPRPGLVWSAGAGLLRDLVRAVFTSPESRSLSAPMTPEAKDAVRVDVVASTRRVLGEALMRRADPSRFAPPGGAGGDVVEIVPFVVLTFTGYDEMRPWVVLVARLKGDGGDRWKTRYVAGGGDSRPAGSGAAGDGARSLGLAA